MMKAKTFVVSYTDGVMPDGISDLELFDVLASIEYDPDVKPGTR